MKEILRHRDVTVEKAEEVVSGKTTWRSFVKGRCWGALPGDELRS